MLGHRRSRRTYQLRRGLLGLADPRWSSIPASVWLGGLYAAAQGPVSVTTAEELTDRVDGIIKATAAERGSYYVDLRAAFKGPDYVYDETHFLSSDRDHPNAAGHEQIAGAVEAVLDQALR